MAAPQRLGIGTVWVDVGGRGLPPDSAVRPDAIMADLPALAAILTAITARL